MTPPQLNPDTDSQPDSFRWSRSDTAQALHDLGDPQQPYSSRRQFARQAGIPHATLDYWVRRQQHRDDLDPDDPQRAAFLQSPSGERFLRRLVLAAHVCFHQAGTCGIRDLCRFLIQAGLDAFVALSYGAQQALAKTLGEQVLAYGQTEQQRLAAGMAAKTIVACLDESPIAALRAMSFPSEIQVIPINPCTGSAGMLLLYNEESVNGEIITSELI